MIGIEKGGAIACPPFLSFILGSDEFPELQRYSGYVPLDFFKCELVGIDLQCLVDNPRLSFCENFNRDTGEFVPIINKHGRAVEYRRVAKYQNLEFTFLPDKNRMFLQGSFHMFFNSGRHNYNDFDLKAFLSVLRDLFNIFGILPSDVKLIQLEWGVNLSPALDINAIIDHCLFHKRKGFEVIKNSPEGRYSQVEHNEYFLKLYNKGLHFKLGIDLLRFERKQRKYCVYSRHNGIGRTLHDLIESNFIELESTLISDWNDILFFEPHASNVAKLVKYRDPKFWVELFKTRKRPTVKRHHDKLKKEFQVRGFTYKKSVKESLVLKLTELRNVVTN